MMPLRYVKLIAAPLGLMLLGFAGTPTGHNYQPQSLIPLLSYNQSPPSDTISINSIILYRIYLDKRGGNNTLRVLAINRCHKANESMLGLRLGQALLPMRPRPMEGRCPWDWAIGCSLGTYLHEVDLPQGVDPHEVLIESDTQSAIHYVHAVFDTPVGEEGLTICVPPIYWYTDWTKIILFVEWWKLQNTTKFIFYHQSSTVAVMQALEYYVKEGIAEIVDWPMLPYSNEFNPNEEVYRLAHSLAQNDCVLRARTEFISIIDFDELLVTRNLTLHKVLHKAGKRIGSLVFPHRVLLFHPPITSVPFDFAKLTFEGVANPVYKKISGPSKIIARRNAVDRISTHRVVSYRGRFWGDYTTPYGHLLHCRYNWVDTQTNHTEFPVKIIGDSKEFKKKLMDTKNAIYPSGTNFNDDTQKVLGKCIGSWRRTQGNCKAPATGCRKVIMTLEDWVEATNPVFSVV